MGSSGWNRPNTANQPKVKKGGAKPNLGKGILAGILVVILAAISYFVIFSRTERRQMGESRKKPNKAAKVEARGSKVVVGKVQNQGSAPEVSHAAAGGEQETDQGDDRDAAGREEVKDVRTLVPQRQLVFTNVMDQLLAMVLPSVPGGKMPPLPISDDMEFSEEDEKKLLERLTARDEDSDEVLDRKELVQSMRDEYHELKKRGWTFINYLRALEAKVQLDAEINEESHQLHDKIFSDASISDEKYTEMLGKINKVLADRGIKPINPREAEEDEAAEAEAVAAGVAAP